MSQNELILRGNRILIPGERQPVPAAVEIRDGKISRVLRGADAANLTGPAIEELGNTLLMPGLVDTHAHINEPGRTEWEGFETATRAACAGGITTVVDMPLNSIPATTTLAALDAKRQAARGKCRIDFGLWGGVVPGNTHELQPMVLAGVPGFKCFLIDSGVEEFQAVNEADLREAMPVLAKLGVPLLVHAEIDLGSAPGPADPSDYHRYVSSRPPQWEIEAIRRVIALARETGCRTHIVHLSAADALEDLARARAEGVPVTAETCPHYLTFCEEEISEGATHFKCAPPIRDRSNRERLWQGIRDGIIDFVVSDHSPCTPHLKKSDTGNFDEAWGGIAGLQFSLSSVWTGMRSRGFELSDLARLMSEAPARFARLESKGTIAPGADADFVLFDENSEFTVNPEQVHHRHSLTPHANQRYFGVVRKTWVRGVPVFVSGSNDSSGEFPGPPPGQFTSPNPQE